VCACALPAWSAAVPAKNAGVHAAARKLYHPREILVKFKTAFTTSAQAFLQNQTGIQASNRSQALDGFHAFFHTQPMGSEHFGWQRVRLPEGKSVEQALADFPQNVLVENAEPNYIRHVHAAISTTYTAYASPSDTYYQNGTLWWFNRIHADQAFSQANYFSPKQIVVAVVDTGTDLTHPDLAARLVTGYNAITPTSQPLDDYGHGTHTSGLVAAVCNNALGTAGAAFTDKVAVMPVKVLDYLGDGLSADIAKGIQWAADHGARVINMSLGGSENSSLESAACAYAYAKGCVIVASAGNDDADLNDPQSYVYPALYANVICVAATNSQDYATSYSNYGSGGEITLAAPGGYTGTGPGTKYYGNDGGVYSTLMTGDYGTMCGTSMAAPQVSAAAAMLILQNPLRTPSEVRALLISHCENPQGQPSDYVGAGRINLAGSLAVYQTPTITVTSTVSPTSTMTPTITCTSTITVTSTISPTSTVSPTITCTLTQTPTGTVTVTSTPWVLGAGDMLIYPQPGREHVRLAFHLTGQGRLRAEAYNVRGEHVLSVSDVPYSSGETAYTDLKTQQLAPGVYFLIARVEDQNGQRIFKKRFAIIH
jgi:subtilisin family serine protease